MVLTARPATPRVAGFSRPFVFTLTRPHTAPELASSCSVSPRSARLEALAAGTAARGEASCRPLTDAVDATHMRTQPSSPRSQGLDAKPSTSSGRRTVLEDVHYSPRLKYQCEYPTMQVVRDQRLLTHLHKQRNSGLVQYGALNRYVSPQAELRPPVPREYYTPGGAKWDSHALALRTGVPKRWQRERNDKQEAENATNTHTSRPAYTPYSLWCDGML